MTLDIKARVITVKGPRGTLTKNLKHMSVDIYKLPDNKVKVEKWFGATKESASIRSACSHMQNMITGVTKVRLRAGWRARAHRGKRGAGRGGEARAQHGASHLAMDRCPTSRPCWHPGCERERRAGVPTRPRQVCQLVQADARRAHGRCPGATWPRSLAASASSAMPSARRRVRAMAAARAAAWCRRLHVQQRRPQATVREVVRPSAYPTPRPSCALRCAACTQGFEYKMRFVYAHFPINVAIVEKDTVVEIRNFLGEKIVRRIQCHPGVTVSRSADVKDEIALVGNDIDNVSLSAALINQACHVKNKDIRKFLDGIYISERNVIGGR